MLKKIIATALLFGFSPLYAAGITKSDIDSASSKWVSAINSSDAVAFTKLYDESGFLFASEFSSKVVNDNQGLTDYLKQMQIAQAKFDIAQSLPQIFDDVSINTEIYTITYTDTASSQKKTIQCRSTTVYKKSGSDLLIVNQHSSKIPDEDMMNSTKQEDDRSITEQDQNSDNEFDKKYSRMNDNNYQSQTQQMESTKPAINNKVGNSPPSTQQQQPKSK